MKSRLSAVFLAAATLLMATGAEAARDTELPPPPAPKPASRPSQTKPRLPDPRAQPSMAASTAARLALINAVKSWGYQLADIELATLQRSPYDLLVVDATTGLGAGRPFRPDEVRSLKAKPDGTSRLVVSYLSIGEAEDYRPEYFSQEYLEEDAPDWLMQENKDWKGNRIIKFCSDGWQRTILGDDDGKSVYGGDESAPLYRLMDLGFDGVYLDRVDVYEEVAKHCPNAKERMIDFVARLSAHARKRNPNFLVILQNAEGLLRDPRMTATIDAIAKEDLFFGQDHGETKNPPGDVADSVANLMLARKAGRPVFVVDYVSETGRKRDALGLIRSQGFLPYIGPRKLNALWLPGKHF